MRRKAPMIGVISTWSSSTPGTVTRPSFSAFVCGYVATAVLSTRVRVAVAMPRSLAAADRRRERIRRSRIAGGLTERSGRLEPVRGAGQDHAAGPTEVDFRVVDT